jgi:hypothetical protein
MYIMLFLYASFHATKKSLKINATNFIKLSRYIKQTIAFTNIIDCTYWSIKHSHHFFYLTPYTLSSRCLSYFSAGQVFSIQLCLRHPHHEIGPIDRSMLKMQIRA